MAANDDDEETGYAAKVCVEAMHGGKHHQRAPSVKMHEFTDSFTSATANGIVDFERGVEHIGRSVAASTFD